MLEEATLLETEIATAEKYQDAPLLRPLDSWTILFNCDLEIASKTIFTELSFQDLA